MAINHKRFLTLPAATNPLEPSPQPQQAAYLEVGQGPTMLLLHGFMGTGECWLPLMEKLQSHYRCISPDLLGFGESSKPMIRYDIAREVAFVRQFIEALDLDPCYIVGHSFGGWVGAAYALQYSTSVRGLVLAASAGIRDDSFCGRYDALRPLLWNIPAVDWALNLVKPLAVGMGKRAAWERIAWFRRELMAQPAPRSFLLDRLRPEDAIDTVEKEIYKLHVPTLVITGDRDETIPLWHSQTYASQISNAQLIVIPNADHALPQKYSQEMAELILPFFGQTTPPSTQTKPLQR